MVSLIDCILEKDSDHPPSKVRAAGWWLLLVLTPTISAGLSVVLLSLVLFAVLAACKVAFQSLQPADLAALSRQNDVAARRILLLRRKPRLLFATLFVVSHFVLLGILVSANLLLEQSFIECLMPLATNETVRALPISYQSLQTNWLHALHFSITTAVIISSVVFFNASAPRWYVPRNRLQFLKTVSAPLLFLVKVLHPLNVLFLNANKLMELPWARLTQQKRPNREESEELSESWGSNSTGDKNGTEPDVDIQKSIIKFNDVTVRQIMTPRTDVVAIDQEDSYAELLEMVRQSGYSRIPVYDGDFDFIKGILYVKDLLGYNPEDANSNWRKLVRTNVLYVPEAKKINELLREFQKKRLHMAIVVDEYGGSAGIVTLEDVLEELIGDIKDEFDSEAEVQYDQLNEQTYLFEGKTLLQEVYRITGIEVGTFEAVRGEADSLAGLILAIHGQLPKENTELTYKNFHFKITAVNKRRIEQVQLTIGAE
jgi:gliding motility-associated protein GldE